MPKILVVEDEIDIRELITFSLEQEGFEVYTAPTGEEGLHFAKKGGWGLILLDGNLPGIDGFEVCKRIRSEPSISQIPILMLTARTSEEDIIQGLELGANDYIAKPFSIRILLARIKRIMRDISQASQEADSQFIEIDGLQIDLARFEVKSNDVKYTLTTSEYRALCFLIKNIGRVYTRNQLMEAVHGDGYIVSERSIDVLLVGLRKKIGPYGERIETVRGVGYRFQ